MKQLSKEEFKNLTYEKIFELLETSESGLSAEETAKRQQSLVLMRYPKKNNH